MKRLIIILSLITFALSSQAQVSQHIVRFRVKDASGIARLPKFLSIDRVDGLTVTAYIANDKDFRTFTGLYPQYEELPSPGQMLRKSKAVQMAYTVDDLTASWDKYPSYDVYVQAMTQIAAQYPHILRLDTIGTSQKGRLLLAMEITDNPGAQEFEPQFFYTSTMHGDEVTGYMFLLRFIYYLAENYGKDSLVTYIVNNYDLYVNPLANPDGTYYGGDNDISGAVRYYANGIDPNRNFEPQPGGFSADDPGYCPETEAMKAFASAHNFVMSANLHGGAEVYNYPWDVWTTSQHAHPDASWFETVGSRFVRYARENNAYYFTSPYSSGVTEGGDWYAISGGRQDYMNYAQHCKEVTLEVSNTKMPDPSTMPTYFKYLLKPMLLYITEATGGLQGLTLDEAARPVQRRIVISNYDSVADSTFVLSRAQDGAFFRPVLPGTYTFQVQDLSGNTVYEKTFETVESGSFALLPDTLHPDSINVIWQLELYGSQYDASQARINVECLTCSDSFSLQFDAAAIAVKALYPGVYRATVDLPDDTFQTVHYFSVYAGMDTVHLSAFGKAFAAVERTSDMPLTVYPNPAVSVVTISQGVSGPAQIRLWDLSGKQVFETTRTLPATIDLSGLRSGVYVLQVISSQGTATVKLVKMSGEM